MKRIKEEGLSNPAVFIIAFSIVICSILSFMDSFSGPEHQRFDPNNRFVIVATPHSDKIPEIKKKQTK